MYLPRRQARPDRPVVIFQPTPMRYHGKVVTHYRINLTPDLEAHEQTFPPPISADTPRLP